jgi:hypothetical protein
MPPLRAALHSTPGQGALTCADTAPRLSPGYRWPSTMRWRGSSSWLSTWRKPACVGGEEVAACMLWAAPLPTVVHRGRAAWPRWALPSCVAGASRCCRAPTVRMHPPPAVLPPHQLPSPHLPHAFFQGVSIVLVRPRLGGLHQSCHNGRHATPRGAAGDHRGRGQRVGRKRAASTGRGLVARLAEGGGGPTLHCGSPGAGVAPTCWG